LILTSWFLGCFPLFLPSTIGICLKILLIAATPMESATIRSHFSIPLLVQGAIATTQYGVVELNLLHTGIGMVNTAWHLGRTFMKIRPDLAIQFGIAGAFAAGPEVLEVVEVNQDCFAELGAESPEGFLSLEKLGFSNFVLDNQPFFNTLAQPLPPLEGLRQCRGVTVNRISGTTAGIEELEQIWAPEVETMEGAAFFQACLLERIPFRALRAVSNRVEPRNRAGWRLKEAVELVQN
jgi:futalosine hydrolase